MDNPAPAQVRTEDVPEDRAEFETMIRGGMYHAVDPYVQKIARQEGAKVRAINAEADDEKRMELLRQFMGIGEEIEFIWTGPFFAEYGFNLKVGHKSYIGPDCKFLNVSPITIGDRVLVGPGVQFYAATHPLSPEERNGIDGPEYSKPIIVEADCWIGGAAVICPGVTIGKGSTVAAGAVVTKNVPPRSVVGGNPAKVLKTV